MSEGPNNAAEWFGRELAKAQSALYAYTCALTAGSPDAWDILQNANRVICQKAGELRSPEGMIPWAYTVVRYEVMAYRKQTAVRRQRFSDVVLDEVAERAAKHNAGTSDRMSALEECLKKLPEHQAQCVTLRYQEGVPLGDIAQRFSRSENAIAAALYRARSALAKCVERTLTQGGWQ
jgi:RNA polymerase sigma-70 factor (ECF subfamily)